MIENTFIKYLKEENRAKTIGLIQAWANFKKQKMVGWSPRARIIKPNTEYMEYKKTDTQNKWRFINTGSVTASSKVPMIAVFRQRKRKKR